MKNKFGFVNKCRIFVLPSQLMVTKNNHMKRKQIERPAYDLSFWRFLLIASIILWIVSQIENF